MSEVENPLDQLVGFLYPLYMRLGTQIPPEYNIPSTVGREWTWLCTSRYQSEMANGNLRPLYELAENGSSSTRCACQYGGSLLVIDDLDYSVLLLQRSLFSGIKPAMAAMTIQLRSTNSDLDKYLLKFREQF